MLWGGFLLPSLTIALFLTSLLRKKLASSIKNYIHCFVCFCLNGSPPGGKKVGIQTGILPHALEQKNFPTSLGQVNHNTTAAGNQTQHLAWYQAATTQADWNSVCPWRNPGVRTAHGWTSGIVWTFCKPFWAFRWFPIQRPSSNSTVR